VIDISLLITLEAYEDDTGHVSIRPSSRDSLIQWIESRDMADTHPYTQEVMDAVVGKQVIRK